MASRADLAVVVERALANAGDVVRVATLTRGVPGAYRPEDGTPGAASVSESAGLAFLGRGGRPSGDFASLMIEPGEAALWLAAVDFAPRPGDRVTVDGAARTVRAVEDVAGAGVLFLVAAR
ncbi:MAG: hypothetical protein H3C38_17090 [Rhodospirillales bacterium]|nr:hypothetical protein [Rhodospirillales bacterium]